MLNRKAKSIDSKDLLFAILYTLILSVAFGIVLGYLDFYLTRSINFTFVGLLYWIIAIYIGKTVRKAVSEPHLVYTIIAGIGMVLSWSIINTVPFLLANGITLADYQTFFSVRIYFQVLIATMNPVTGISSGILDYLITLLIFSVGTYLGVKKTLK